MFIIFYLKVNHDDRNLFDKIFLHKQSQQQKFYVGNRNDAFQKIRTWIFLYNFVVWRKQWWNIAYIIMSCQKVIHIWLWILNVCTDNRNERWFMVVVWFYSLDANFIINYLLTITHLQEKLRWIGRGVPRVPKKCPLSPIGSFQ